MGLLGNGVSADAILVGAARGRTTARATPRPESEMCARARRLARRATPV
jgi:hypothetical protein